jgi:hypothetical protein
MVEKVPRENHHIYFKPSGGFKPGHPGFTTTGRPKGKPNKINADLKQGIIDGAAKYGSDGRGSGGLQGYLKMCAGKYPREYLQLLARILPLQFRGELDVPPGTVAIGEVNIITAPSDSYVTAERAAELMRGPPGPHLIVDNAGGHTADEEHAIIDAED